MEIFLRILVYIIALIVIRRKKVYSMNLLLVGALFTAITKAYAPQYSNLALIVFISGIVWLTLDIYHNNLRKGGQ